MLLCACNLCLSIFSGRFPHDDRNARHKSSTFLFCDSTTTSSVVWVGSAAAAEHPLSVSGEHHAVGSPFITAPPRNQSIKFNIALATAWPISAQRGWSRTVVREGSSQWAVELVRQRGSRQRSLVAWTRHYSCPRCAYLRRRDEAR